MDTKGERVSLETVADDDVAHVREQHEVTKNINKLNLIVVRVECSISACDDAESVRVLEHDIEEKRPICASLDVACIFGEMHVDDCIRHFGVLVPKTIQRDAFTLDLNNLCAEHTVSVHDVAHVGLGLLGVLFRLRVVWRRHRFFLVVCSCFCTYYL